MKWCFFILYSFAMIFSTPKIQAQKLLIGTYTKTDLSKGIYIYDFDSFSAKATEITHIKTSNPSFLIADKNQKFVYSVNEEDDKGAVSAFAYNKENNTLQLINTQSSNGKAPCYISLDKTGKWLFTGNYSSGNLAVYRILPDGSIGPMHQFIQHTGSSINKKRQSAPHVHCTYISADNKMLYVPDLGLDKVMVYPFNAETGHLDTTNKTYISVDPGGGPRHIIFSKNGRYAYLVEEMSGTVNVIKKSKGLHTIIQSENHLPQGQKGSGADIHLSPDENFLYASQRSNSTIQIFKVNKKTGRIQYIGEQSVMGVMPRNFTIHPSGKYLLAANQKSNDITIFKRDIKTGLLTYTGERIQVGAPVCLQWIGY